MEKDNCLTFYTWYDYERIKKGEIQPKNNNNKFHHGANFNLISSINWIERGIQKLSIVSMNIGDIKQVDDICNIFQ
jgi:hypothetical protein